MRSSAVAGIEYNLFLTMPGPRPKVLPQSLDVDLCNILTAEWGGGGPKHDHHS